HLIATADSVLLSIVARSLAVSACACLLACVFGMAAGSWLAVARFRGRGIVLTLLNTSLALPSVVVGLVVYLLLSHSGPLGFLGWLFSFQAMVLAQTVLVVPIVTALVRQTVEDAERHHGEQLRSLRARSMVRALPLVWDERFTLLTIVITALGRAVSEVGAVMVVGGNIEGYTRVMTTAIALETSKGDLPLAVALGLILLLVVLLLNILAALVRRWRERRDAGLSGLFGAAGAVQGKACAPKRLRAPAAQPTAVRPPRLGPCSICTRSTSITARCGRCAGCR